MVENWGSPCSEMSTLIFLFSSVFFVFTIRRLLPLAKGLGDKGRGYSNGCGAKEHKLH